MQTDHKISFKAILLVVTFCCCNGPVNVNYENFEYPLAVGNQWKYRLTMGCYNARPDSLAHLNTVYVDDTIQTTVVRIDTLPAGKVATVLRDTVARQFTETWYSQAKDGLYILASRSNVSGSYTTLYKRSTAGRTQFKGRSFSSLRALHLWLMEGSPANVNLGKTAADTPMTIEETPVKIVRYPYEKGCIWTYRDHIPAPADTFDSGFRICKQYIGKETISCPAGRFLCYKIQWHWDWNNDGAWDKDFEGYEYVSSQGIVMRTLAICNMVATDGYGQPIGTFDDNDTLLLIETKANK